ncbi:MAG: DUF547 domain-containing protein [Flavobacteriaceae bacterium]|nr:DUF547 domain-containing protein [Flavobacteriaceae bacterium]
MPEVEKVIPEQLPEDNVPASEKQEVSNDTIIEQDVLPVVEKLEINEAVSEELDHSAWDKLLKKHVSNNGNVDYQGFKQNETELNRYLKFLSDNPPKPSWSEKEILAYWINVYNAFTVKLIVHDYPVQSIKDIDGPWNVRIIRIGTKWYTLNDVEHRIIRKMNEPRIHFALVCAAISCPRLYNKAFTAKNLEDDLNMLTREFLNDTSKNIITENSIQLSKIFKWYGGDFRKNGNTLNGFLSEYTGIDISPNAKKSFLDYNWALNE